MYLFLYIIISFFIVSCGDNLNFNKIFVLAEEQETPAAMLEAAQVAFDARDYDTALELAGSVLKKTGEPEAVFLEAHAHIYKGGLDLFEFVLKLMEILDKNEVSTGADSTWIFMDNIRKALGITDAHLLSISEEYDDNGRFPHKVFLPLVNNKGGYSFASTTVVAVKYPLVYSIGKVLKTLCPYVPEAYRRFKKKNGLGLHDCVPIKLLPGYESTLAITWMITHLAVMSVEFARFTYIDPDSLVAKAGSWTSNLTENMKSILDPVNFQTANIWNTEKSVCKKDKDIIDPGTCFQEYLNDRMKLFGKLEVFWQADKERGSVLQTIAKAVSSLIPVINTLGGSFDKAALSKINNDLLEKVSEFPKIFEKTMKKPKESFYKSIKKMQVQIQGITSPGSSKGFENLDPKKYAAICRFSSSIKGASSLCQS